MAIVLEPTTLLATQQNPDEEIPSGNPYSINIPEVSVLDEEIEAEVEKAYATKEVIKVGLTLGLGSVSLAFFYKAFRDFAQAYKI